MEDLPSNWERLLRNIDASALPKSPQGSAATPFTCTASVEAMIMMYSVGLFEMFADNPRAKRRVLEHLAGMNGFTLARIDRRQKPK